jgi:hypothetical protein
MAERPVTPERPTIPERTVTCGECGACRTVAPTDLPTQLGAIEDWERQHEAQAHGGQRVSWTVDPDPARD